MTISASPPMIGATADAKLIMRNVAISGVDCILRNIPYRAMLYSHGTIPLSGLKEAGQSLSGDIPRLAGVSVRCNKIRPTEQSIGRRKSQNPGTHCPTFITAYFPSFCHRTAFDRLFDPAVAHAGAGGTRSRTVGDRMLAKTCRDPATTAIRLRNGQRAKFTREAWGAIIRSM
jgi:hypothetical protein